MVLALLFNRPSFKFVCNLVLGLFVCASCHSFAEYDVVHPDYNERYNPKGEVEAIDVGNGEAIYLDKADSTYYYADVLLSKEQVQQLVNPNTKAAILTQKSARWSGIIPYHISSSFSTTAQTVIRNGVSMVESAVKSIKFQESSSIITASGINFQLSTSNYSPLGKQVVNNINIESSISSPGTVAHEILHSLGYLHEQNRTDRDSYVIINYNNILSGHEHNFYTFSQMGYTAKNFGPYDFSSIMNYDSWSYTSNYLPTMTKLDGSTFNSQRSYLTNGDLEAIDRLYGPIPHIVSTLVADDDYSSGDIIRYTYYFSNKVYFWDIDLVPMATSYQKSLKLTLSTYHQEGDNPQDGYTTNDISYVNIPAGTSYYSIPGYTTYQIYEVCGITYLIHDEQYYVEINP